MADSKCTEAYKLFEIKSRLIDVAIELGLDEKTTRKYWAEYLRLKNIDILTEIYTEVGPDLTKFLELYKVIRLNELTPNDVDYVAQKIVDVQELEQYEASLRNRIKILVSQKMKLGVDLDGMQQRWGMLEKYCDELKDEIDLREFRIRKLKEERMDIEEEGEENRN